MKIAPQYDKHLGAFAQACRCSGAQQDRAFRKYERGILHKHRVGIGFERCEHVYGQPGRAQRRNIDSVFLQNPIIAWLGPRIAADTPHHAAPRLAYDRLVEVEDACHWLPWILSPRSFASARGKRRDRGAVTDPNSTL